MNCHIIGIKEDDAYPVKPELESELRRFQEYIGVLVTHGIETKKMYSAVLNTLHFDQDIKEWAEEIASGRKLAEMQQEDLVRGEDTILNAMVSPAFLSNTLFGRFLNLRFCQICGEELPENWLYEYCGECMSDAGVET